MLINIANENSIMLQADIDSKTNLNLIKGIYGDSRRYLQILMNFLSNALKFTNRKGNVRISIQVKDRQKIDDDLMYIQLQIKIIDNGIGISDEGQKKLFVDFGKLDESSLRNR